MESITIKKLHGTSSAPKDTKPQGFVSSQPYLELGFVLFRSWFVSFRGSLSAYSSREIPKVMTESDPRNDTNQEQNNTKQKLYGKRTNRWGGSVNAVFSPR
jgi:hypothetical protein